MHYIIRYSSQKCNAINLRGALGGKKAPAGFFAPLKNLSSVGRSRFMIFLNMKEVQYASVRSTTGAPEAFRHVVKRTGFLNRQNFTLVFTHTAECLQSKYSCNCSCKNSFYRASAVAASPVLATIGMSVRLSVRPSVRLSVTPWHCVKTR